jgi:recombination protein RecR
MNDPFEQLVTLFKQFPGVGLRQAKRFVYFLLQQDPTYVDRMVRALNNTRQHIHLCAESFQFFVDQDSTAILSPIVRDSTRTKEQLMIVIKDLDLENIERTHAYQGQYFVLGNLVPMIATDVEKYVRINQLESLITQRAQNNNLNEIIFSTPTNPEGEHTRAFVLSRIQTLLDQFNLKTTTLGRGLSTGTELEYIDPDTFRNALNGRI